MKNCVGHLISTLSLHPTLKLVSIFQLFSLFFTTFPDGVIMSVSLEGSEYITTINSSDFGAPETLSVIQIPRELVHIVGETNGVEEVRTVAFLITGVENLFPCGESDSV